MIKIQVALDVIEPDRAVSIAEEAVAGGADWIEAGTPLIKSAGMEIIRKLRETFPDNIILADMKTMDVGAAEVEMAAKSGADVVTILAAAEDVVITQALMSAEKYGARVMVDLISVPDPVTRAKEVEALGVDLVNVHVGIDAQMTGESPIDKLKKLVSETGMEIAVAGGLTPETAHEAVLTGADIVVVGSYIINSDNVRQSAANVRKAVDSNEKITLKKKSAEEEMVEIFNRVSTSNISDAMHRKGAMQGISSKIPGKKIVGKAVTVRSFGGDWAKPVEAIDISGPGDIIVIYNGNRDIAMWGGLATQTAVSRKLEGVVIDGAVRDFDEVQKMNFPVFAANIVPNAGDPKGLGEINVEIVCGNQTVHPGDYIIGDDSGVVVVPKERAYEIARRSEEVWKHEKRLFEEIKNGKTLAGALDLLKWETQK
ncbi:3-hexulose-6-phosphate synthase [Methanimicrococcus blatticola]|uniref:3-hexulose-6-phosphate synthase n=1 Tax=Methanimicrococcus blatticola TaxID=91560 RepID=A0A484F6D6_9EURY|nr:3-hexulose-6-phosphate synthase [Methanimicrococcus blatticola]MBZ3935173.1 orotidine 5'-phosphate decarboxylase [Methanimicrococcus blatticola]MCC2508730.1 orotidine 5'-phosphate decarboxylase [Methanimicrococcus blatticola]TDQ71234.1 3-hexulose-6-phosphate synthase [Methanimicrococcus blatticola]